METVSRKGLSSIPFQIDFYEILCCNALLLCLKTSEKSLTQIIDIILKKSRKSIYPSLFCVRESKKNYHWG